MSELNRFGYEWSTFSEIIPLYEHQFRAWVQPLEPPDFQGLRVLDAGCGTGRNSAWALQYGAKELVAFDVDSRSVSVAKRNLATYRNARVEEYSIYEIPYENEFDLVFAIGVIHHLQHPVQGIVNLVRSLRPGGRLLIWCYGKEGYTAIKNAVNAVRRVTCRMPTGLLNTLTKPLSAIWWTYLKVWPHKDAYHRLLRPAPFWHLHSILFDQLLPEIANYWTKEELVALFCGIHVDIEHVTWVNEGSWTVIARKKSET